MVSFVYHDNLTDEAMMVIPGLPLVLEEHLGPRIWNWFHEDARDDVEGFKCDEDKGIVSIEEEDTEDTVGDWAGIEGLDDDEEDMSDDEETRKKLQVPSIAIPFALNLDTPGKNQYGDAGSIKTTDLNPSGVSDSSPSTSTLTDPSDDMKAKGRAAGATGRPCR